VGGMMKIRNIEPQEWWASLSNGERRLICSVMKMLRGAKQSEIREVARAAVKWERGIGCFIKVRLMNERPRRRVATWTISCPSIGRSQPGAAPSQG